MKINELILIPNNCIRIGTILEVFQQESNVQSVERIALYATSKDNFTDCLLQQLSMESRNLISINRMFMDGIANGLQEILSRILKECSIKGEKFCIVRESSSGDDNNFLTYAVWTIEV